MIDQADDVEAFVEREVTEMQRYLVDSHVCGKPQAKA